MRLRSRVEIRPFRPQHAAPPDRPGRVRPPRHPFHQRAGPGGYEQPGRQGDVHHHRGDGGTGVVSRQRAGHGGHGGGESAGKAHEATPDAGALRIETLARTTDMSVRQIHKELKGNVGRVVVGEIVKRTRQEKTLPLSR